MPWKTSEEDEARRRFIADWLEEGDEINVTALCRRHAVSRDCGYKWWGRFLAGGLPALTERSRRPVKAQRKQEVWQARLWEVKRRLRRFGPKKLHWALRCDYPRARVPHVRTLARWLQRAGKVRVKRRRPPGPRVRIAGRLRGRSPNDVWTIDFKGRFRTRDGRWVYALTVCDLASGCVLCVRHLARPVDKLISRELRRLFRRHGLPRAMRMDNGQPFGATGPRGWSRLNIAWLALGIRLEHGRPGCPQDNACHEQMHRVLKEEATQPPSPNARAQQRRFDRWRYHYNHRRPHERLGMQPPASRYRPSPRPLPSSKPHWVYPATYQLLRTDAKGRWQWRGQARYLGRALVGEQLAARTISVNQLAIYLGPHLLGHLHADDPGTFRIVQRRIGIRSGRG